MQTNKGYPLKWLPCLFYIYKNTKIKTINWRSEQQILFAPNSWTPNLFISFSQASLHQHGFVNTIYRLCQGKPICPPPPGLYRTMCASVVGFRVLSCPEKHMHTITQVFCCLWYTRRVGLLKFHICKVISAVEQRPYQVHMSWKVPDQD